MPADRDVQHLRREFIGGTNDDKAAGAGCFRNQGSRECLGDVFKVIDLLLRAIRG
jgi:hypothetical protein